MPLYDYHCEKCNKAFEVVVPIEKSDKKVKCPHCCKPLKKIMSAPMFRIK